MQIRDFAAQDYPALAEIHNRLNIAWPERPRTPEAWAQADRNRNPRTLHHRWVAEEDGQVVGFAAYSRSPWTYPPGGFDIIVEVRPDCQRRGTGAALYALLEEEVRAYQPPALRADAFTNLPQGFAFLQKRGFYEAFRETPVHLEVGSFDERPYAGLQAGLVESGIVLRTLAELRSEAGYERKLYELYNTIEEDVPREGPFEKPAFEDWASWALHDPSILEDACLVAVEGGEYVGLRELGQYGGQEALLGGLLGVRREYRGRKVALALVLANIAYARAHGYRLLKDCTAAQNAPMQALFNRLGFARDPQWQQCQKDFAGGESSAAAPAPRPAV